MQLEGNLLNKKTLMAEAVIKWSSNPQNRIFLDVKLCLVVYPPTPHPQKE